MSQIIISTTNTAVNTNSSATLVYLPAAATASTNTVYFIQDATGNAANSTIYIYASGADTLDNQVSVTALLQTNYASIYLSPDGVSNWMVFKAALQAVATGFPQGVYIAFVYPNVVTVWSGAYSPYTVRFFRNAAASTSGGTLVETATATSNTQTSTVLLVSNQYYYSIITYNGNSTTSINFTQATLLPYRPLAPFIAFVYPNLVVTWKASLQTTTYTVAFYRVATAIQTFTNVTTLAISSTVTLTNASYYAIITAVNRYGSTSTQTPTIQATLIAAPSSATLTLYFTALTVTWTPSSAATSYSVTLYYNSALYATITTTATTYSTTPNFFGTYYAIVTAINIYGTNSITTNSVTYSTQAPVITVLTQGSGNNALYFTWSSTNTTSWNLVVEIVDAGQQLPFTTLNGTTSQGGGTIQTGQPVFFTATLNVTGPGGTTQAFFTGFSGTTQSNPSIIIRNPTPVTSPTIALSGLYAVCSWIPVADATSYTVVFYRLPGSILIQSTSAITTTSQTSPVLANSYSYYATVTSVSANAYSSAVPTNTTAIVNNPPSPITAGALLLVGLYALATWSGSVNATSYTIVFYQTDTQVNTGGIILETDTPSAASQLSVNQLTFGYYYYAIITPANVNGKAAPFTTASIGVNSSPPAAVASFTISVSGLYVQCTWSPTTYASYYTVTFYQNTSALTNGGTVFETNTTTGTSQTTSAALVNEYYYYATITATNTFGTSPVTSSGFTTLIIRNIPTTPTNVLVTFSESQVVATWSASTNATTYTTSYFQVERATTSGGGSVQTITTSETTSSTSVTLLNGYYYYSRVYATNIYGSSIAITSAGSALVSGILPSELSAVSMSFLGTQITANWSMPANATSFTVVFYQVPTQAITGGTVFETATSTSNSRSITLPLVNDLYYYAIVTPQNIYGSSTPVTSTTAVLSAILPFNPTNPTISFSDYSVSTRWNSSSYSTSYTIVFYQVSTQRTSGGTLFETVTGQSGTNQATSISLVNAVYYYATITGVNIYGSSSTITTTNAIQARAAPVAVTAVSLVGSGLATLISWTSSAYSTTYTTLLYQVSSSQTTAGTLFETKTGQIGTTQLTTTALLNGYYYYATVTGVNQFASSAPVSSSEAIGPITNIPTAPTNVSVSFSNSQITASWSASINVDSYTVLFYEVATPLRIGGSLFETATAPGLSQSTSSVLVNGYYYYATVTANNIYGSSAAVPSATTTPLITTILPTAPTNVAVSFAGTSVTTTWTASTANATGYTIAVYETASPVTLGGSVIQSDTFITGTSKSTTVVLLNDYYYYARVTATNANGSSATVTSASTTVALTGIFPTNPTQVAISFAGVQATVSWLASYRNATSYTINFYQRSTPGTTGGTLFETDTGTVGLSQINVAGLAYNQYYYATVTADNIYGSSSAIVSINSVVAGFVPLPPTNVAISFAGTQLTATWTAGSYVATYTTRFYQVATPVTTSGSLFETVTGNTGTSQLSSIVLVNGTYYYAIVTSVNPYGTAAATSATTTDQITTILPTNPSNVAVSFAGTQVTANWTASLKNATSYSVIFYQVASAITNGGTTFETTTPTGTTQLTSAILLNGYYYYATVTGVNVNGTSSTITSASTTPAITGILPSPPTNVSINMTGFNAIASWTAGVFNVLTYTVVFYQNATATISGGSSFQTITGQAGTSQTSSTALVNTYYYYATVTSVNAYGSSSSVISSNTTIQIANPPFPPASVSISLSGNQASVSWSAVTNAATYTVVIYNPTTNTTSGGTVLETGSGLTGTSTLSVNTLTSGQYYYATVLAINTYGTSATTTSASAMLASILPTGGAVALNSLSSTYGTVTITRALLATNYTIYISPTTSSANSVYNFTTTTAGAPVFFTPSPALTASTTYYSIVVPSNIYGNGQISYSTGVSCTLYSLTTNLTFTPSGATGKNGPTLSQCRTAYSSYGSWVTNTSYFNMTRAGIQQWTVPATDTYVITCAGAGSSVSGAILTATFSLTEGQVINILIGQMPTCPPSTPGGTSLATGAGGTFVVSSTNTPIIIAGGAAGYRVASTTTTPTLAGGSGGGGGASGGFAAANNYYTGCRTYGASGGGGFTGNGTAGANGGSGGLSFTNGGTGGENTYSVYSGTSYFDPYYGNLPLFYYYAAYGGFGGGGGAGGFENPGGVQGPYGTPAYGGLYNYSSSGGGGGGYNGGNGGIPTGSGGGGGGGGASYCSVTITSSSVTNTGAGYVIINNGTPFGGSIIFNTNLTQTSGSVTITAATNASSYNVYISLTTNVSEYVYTFTTSTTGSAVNFIPSPSLASGTFYYAIFLPVNGTKYGTYSYYSTAIGTAPVPTGGSVTLSLSVSLTNGSITISPSQNVTNYTVYISTTTSISQSVYSFTTTTTGSAVNFTANSALPTDVNLYAVVLASNSYGNGLPFYSSSQIIPSNLYTFSGTLTFTPAAATGTTGPTLSQCVSSYSSFGAWVSNTSYFTMVTQGNQLWTVPNTRTYTITCAGAGNGGSVSAGAVITTTVSLTIGQQLNIVIGQQGSTLGGCGGSFVYNVTTATTLIASGGGGNGTSASAASLTTSGISSGGAGGTNGAAGTAGSMYGPILISGGSVPSDPQCSGYGPGYQSTNVYNYGGNGGLGYSSNGTYTASTGAFGGGGLSGDSLTTFSSYYYRYNATFGTCTRNVTTSSGTQGKAGLGGGGGYSGGGGGSGSSSTSGGGADGGGGGSYCATTITSSSVTNTGQGYVSIT